MSMVELVVRGIPQQQGSKNPWGGDANKNLKPWRTAVMDKGEELMGDRPPLDGPIEVEVYFYFPRPKAHYRANGELKPNAPKRHMKKPDADKLARALGDALTGIVIKDDAVISDWIIRKRFSDIPRTRAVITQLREATDDHGTCSGEREDPR